MIADHVQRMLRAHQRRRDGDLPAAGGVRNETRPGAGSCDSAREGQRPRTRHTREVTSGGHGRSRRVAGEGLGARGLGAGYARPRSLSAPGRGAPRALPYPWSG